MMPAMKDILDKPNQLDAYWAVRLRLLPHTRVVLDDLLYAAYRAGAHKRRYEDNQETRT